MVHPTISEEAAEGKRGRGRFLPLVFEARRGYRKEDKGKVGVFPYLVTSQSLLKVGISWKDGVSGRGDGE